MSIFPSHTSRVGPRPAHRRAPHVADVTRNRAAMPKAPVATSAASGSTPAASQGRGSRPFPAYTRARYLPHSSPAYRRRQPMFRIS